MAHYAKGLRLAVITPEYPPDVIGGGGIVVEALAGEYANSNEVRVFSAWDSMRSWRGQRLADRREGISVYRYPLVPVLRRQLYLRSVLPPNAAASVHLSKDLREWAPDVAHLHGYGYALVDLAAAILSHRKVPYIFTVHGLPQTQNQRGKAIRAAYSAYERIGATRTMARASAVTAISEAVAGVLPKGREVHVIPNGITPLPSSDDDRVANLRQQLELDPDVPLVAAAGRLARSKGFDVLLRALRFVDVPRLACVIAGVDGGELSRLLQLARELPSNVKVSLPGWFDRQRLSDLFRLAAVVAVPSRDEPFGLVALEALGSRRRVVASRIGGLAEFLRPPFAELVDSEDPNLWATAIMQALSRGPFNDEERVAAGRVLAEHSWRQIAQRYELLMKACGPQVTLDAG